MDKTFCARFASHQEAMDTMHEVRNRFPDVANVSEKKGSFDKPAADVPTKNFWGSVGGVFMPSFTTNHDTAESTLSNRAHDFVSDMTANEAYKLTFTAPEENREIISSILESGGGARIQIL